jgi:hypothetical protein
MRLHYDLATERLIIKLVSSLHEYAHTVFMTVLTDHVRTLGISGDHLSPTGAGRQKGSEQRDKEADAGFKPLNTRPGKDDKPTMVIEAGLSETLNQLRNDAHFWLTKANGEVKIVYLSFSDHASFIYT